MKFLNALDFIETQNFASVQLLCRSVPRQYVIVETLRATSNVNLIFVDIKMYCILVF